MALPTPRPSELTGTLRAEQVRSGVAHGPSELFQRRIRPRVFGEPAFEDELVPADIAPARPHRIAWAAHGALLAAATADGIEPQWLAIRSAYRPVALQHEIWRYRLDERREARRTAGLPPLPERDLERQQRLWTAKPGQSAHHTGFALDFALYTLGPRAGRAHPAYRWLCVRAREFGFYPYRPEPWHWEYNPPGLVDQLRALRERLAAGEPADELLVPPSPIPRAAPRPRRGGPLAATQGG